MVWSKRDRKVQRRAERQGSGRARRVDSAAVAEWAAERPVVTPASERSGQVPEPAMFRPGVRDGVPGYEIAGRWYRGHPSDRIVAQRPDAVLVRRDYGEADGDGLWRNCVLYDLRPTARWRRYDLAWQVHRRVWRRCQASRAVDVWAPELLDWVEREVREWPRTLAERITAAERAVGALAQGGEVSTAITRALAFERKPLSTGAKRRDDDEAE